MADISVGSGVEANAGKIVAIHYIGKFVGGKSFDDSFKRDEPLVFELGAGNVIKGLERGIEGMRVNGKRRIVISPEMAYGDKGLKTNDGGYVIPPGSTIEFDVLLLDAGK